MIDKVFCYTIPRLLKNRGRWFLQGLLEKEVPLAKVRFFESIDRRDYKKLRDLCVDAAKEFELFQIWLDTKFYNDLVLAYIAQIWAYLRFFEQVVEENIVALCMQDDRMLNIPFGELEKEVEVISKHNPEWWYANVGHWGKAGQTSNYISEDSLWAQADVCCPGADTCFLITPIGAENILSLAREHWHPDSEYIVEIKRTPYYDVDGTLFYGDIRPEILLENIGASICPKNMYLLTGYGDVKELKQAFAEENKQTYEMRAHFHTYVYYGIVYESELDNTDIHRFDKNRILRPSITVKETQDEDYCIESQTPTG